MAFDYSSTDTDDETVRRIAGEIAGTPLAPLSDQERAERELWREQLRNWEEQSRSEAERKRAVAQSIAERERRTAQVEANRKARLERAAEIERRKREVELRNLQIKVQQQSWWQQSVENAARVHEAQQRLAARLALIDDWAPKPPPEPTVVVVEPEDDIPDKRWFQR